MGKTFVDFIADTAKNKVMAQEAVDMVKNKTAVEVAEWFKQKGYDVLEEDCQKLVDNKDQVEEISTDSPQPAY